MLATMKKRFMNLCPKSLQKTSVNALQRFRKIHCKMEMFFAPEKLKGYCPCCGYRFKTFTAGSYAAYPNRFNSERYKGINQDVLCPVCRSLPRHRILALWSEAHKEILQNSKILYFAPEYSMMLWMKRNGIKCLTADLYNEADLKLDIQDTKMDAESFDIVICNHVLEHVNNLDKALSELYRIIRTGGSLICSFPMDKRIELLDESSEPLSEKECFQRFGQNDHKRVFGIKAEQLLINKGFNVVTIHGEDYSDEIKPVVGPADYDMNILFYASKDKRD